MSTSRINSGIRFVMRVTLAFSLLYLGGLAGSAWRASTLTDPLAAEGPCPDRRCENDVACDEETYLNYRCDDSGPICLSKGCTESS